MLILFIASVFTAYTDRSGQNGLFIKDITVPLKDTVWSTGDTVTVKWSSEIITPNPYPTDGIRMALYQVRTLKDSILVKYGKPHGTELQDERAEIKLIKTDFRIGANQVTFQVPRFIMKEQSAKVYFAWYTINAVGVKFFYAKSDVFRLNNTEFDEKISKEEPRYIDSFITPKFGDRFYPNQTVKIQFQTFNPFPPKKFLTFCLLKGRSDDCIEKFNHRGSAAGLVQLWYTIPDTIPVGTDYRLQLKLKELVGHRVLFTSGKFSISNAGVQPVLPVSNSNIDAVVASSPDFAPINVTVPFIYTPTVESLKNGTNFSKSINSTLPVVNMTDLF